MMAACKHGSKGALKERRYLRSLFARCAQEDRCCGVRKEEQATHDAVHDLATAGLLRFEGRLVFATFLDGWERPRG